MDEGKRQEYILERDRRISEVKAKANEIYLKLKENQEQFKALSKEYVDILKAIEIEIIKPNF